MSRWTDARERHRDRIDMWVTKTRCEPCQGYGGYMPSVDMYTKETGWQTCAHCVGTGFRKGTITRKP